MPSAPFSRSVVGEDTFESASPALSCRKESALTFSEFCTATAESGGNGNAVGGAAAAFFVAVDGISASSGADTSFFLCTPGNSWAGRT